MKKACRYTLISFVYIFLALEGFIGGGTTHNKDIWDDLVKWAKK